MLSDDSSSESETGRFKSNAKTERDNAKQDCSRLPRGAELLPKSSRSRYDERSFKRESDKRNENRGRFDWRHSHSRDRNLSHRHSSPRHRYPRGRTPDRPRISRENPQHHRSRDVKEKDIIKSDDTASERLKKRSASPKSSQDSKRNFREEIRKNIVANISKDRSQQMNRSEEKGRSTTDRNSMRNLKDVSLDHRVESKHKISELLVLERSNYKEKPNSPGKKQSLCKNRRYSEKQDNSDTEQPASYYNLITAKEDITVDDTIHSVTDSSEDEEKLRAKLLNLEKQLDKSKKRKSKKSKKTSKSKHKDKDIPVEVSSTTDIIQLKEADMKNNGETFVDIVDVSSTEVRVRKASSEEGEICSDENGANLSIDLTDLRHRLKRSTAATDTSGSPDLREKLKPKVEAAGPALPPHMRMDESSPTHKIEGPKLPPHLQRNRNIGPIIPSEMRKVLSEASQDQTEVHYTSSEDEGIGPLPQGAEEKWTVAHKKLEERALRMKIRDLESGSSKSDLNAREEWMLELPEAKAKCLGLGSRQFRSKAGPDMSDRSSWTDTPNEKALKAAGLTPAPEASTTTLQQEAHERFIAERDRDQEKAVKKHKKKHKREESLLELHQKKTKKNKKEDKEEGGSKRRPFDRNIDMQVDRFDEAQKRSIIKKAQQLDARFSSGHVKYL